MAKGFKAAKLMLKDINKGTAARKMLSKSNEFAKKLSKKV